MITYGVRRHMSLSHLIHLGSFSKQEIESKRSTCPGDRDRRRGGFLPYRFGQVLLEDASCGVHFGENESMRRRK